MTMRDPNQPPEGPPPTTVDGLPALPTDFGAAPMEFDPVVGREAYIEKLPELEDMTPADVRIPTCDLKGAAVVARAMVKALRSPARAQVLAKLPADLMDGATVDDLEKYAWVVWFVMTRAQSADALTLSVKVDPALVDAAMKLRARMLKLLDYHFHDDLRMLGELADIRQGTGFLDLASDLTRLGHHYKMHVARISKDPVLFHADDEALALKTANGILTTFQAGDPNSATTDMRNRAFTKLDATYASLRSAMEFAYRNNPRELSSFPALRTAVLALTARSSRGADGDDVVPSPAPVPPVAPADPAPTPGPFSRDPSPGTPGGKPFI